MSCLFQVDPAIDRLGSRLLQIFHYLHSLRPPKSETTVILMVPIGHQAQQIGFSQSRNLDM